MSTWPRTLGGDIVIPLIGQTAPPLVTDPNQQAAIVLADELQFWLGEWFLNTLEGFPWQSVLGVKNPSLVAIRRLVQRVALGVPPIVSVQDVTFNWNRPARNLTYQLIAKTSSAAVITGGSNQPFVVQVGP